MLSSAGVFDGDGNLGAKCDSAHIVEDQYPYRPLTDSVSADLICVDLSGEGAGEVEVPTQEGGAGPGGGGHEIESL
jgi:hypothetical protein